MGRKWSRLKFILKVKLMVLTMLLAMIDKFLKLHQMLAKVSVA